MLGGAVLLALFVAKRDLFSLSLSRELARNLSNVSGIFLNIYMRYIPRAGSKLGECAIATPGRAYKREKEITRVYDDNKFHIRVSSLLFCGYIAYMTFNNSSTECVCEDDIRVVRFITRHERARHLL